MIGGGRIIGSPLRTQRRSGIFAFALALGSAACLSAGARPQERLVDVGALDPALVLEMRWHFDADGWEAYPILDEPL